jgi:dGTP triphosphohydrolase
MFPAYFRGELGNGLPKLKYPRMVADVIASMSEVQAIETFQRLTGQSFGSALIRPSI